MERVGYRDCCFHPQGEKYVVPGVVGQQEGSQSALCKVFLSLAVIVTVFSLKVQLVTELGYHNLVKELLSVEHLTSLANRDMGAPSSASAFNRERALMYAQCLESLEFITPLELKAKLLDRQLCTMKLLAFEAQDLKAHNTLTATCHHECGVQIEHSHICYVSLHKATL